MDLKALYQTNKDFQKYVDGYCKNYNESRSITVDEALSHVLVGEVAEMYVGNQTPKEFYETKVNCGC